ncbi:MAG: hypothetical protein R3230_06800 [Nitrosopumilaceae archaeon]|nr:hypothetical protein [Nitrosopumilaceae archaeon]
MDRIRRLSMEILNKHKSDFGIDFTDNKKALEKISVIRSKGLKNEIAGFITKFLKHEIREQKEKEEREKQFEQQMSENQSQDVTEVTEESKPETEDAPVTEEPSTESSETTIANETTESSN